MISYFFTDPKRVHSLPDDGSLPGGDDEPVTFREDIESNLDKAVKVAKEFDREELAIIVGKHVLKRTLEDLAAEFGITSGGMGARVHRARKALRQRCEDAGVDRELLARRPEAFLAALLAVLRPARERRRENTQFQEDLNP